LVLKTSAYRQDGNDHVTQKGGCTGSSRNENVERVPLNLRRDYEQIYGSIDTMIYETFGLAGYFL